MRKRENTMIDERFKVAEDRPFHRKFWPEGIPYELDYDYSLSLVDLFNSATEKYSKETAIWFLNTWVTYSELRGMVDRFATYLHQIGVKKGDVVAIDLPNCIQYEVAYFAIVKLGGIVIGVNPTYTTNELLHQMRLSGAQYLVVLDVIYEKMVSKIEKDWSFKKIIYTNFVDLATGLSSIAKFIGSKILKKIPSAKIDHPNAVAFMDCLKTESNVPKVSIDPENDPVVLSMTGGTTGISKAATLTHRNVVANTKQIALVFLKQRPEGNIDPQLGFRTAFIGILPLFHCYAMSAVMNLSIDIGGYQILFPRPPQPKDFLKTIHKLPNYNRFVHYTVEFLLTQFLKVKPKLLRKYPITGRIAICGTGGGVLHDYVRNGFEEKTGGKITEGYGLSEASALVTLNKFYGEREPGYIGTPASSTDIEIFDQDDFSKGPLHIYGEEGIGEICVRGPQVMRDYWNNPEATKETIRKWKGKKWLLTGDIGYMDEYGRIKILDRKKELIKMAGRSVFPSEVESSIGKHPEILEAAVAGVPDEKTGEAVKAWIVPNSEQGLSITMEELKEWMRGHMAYWKIPKHIEIRQDLPKTTIGKIERRKLRENDPLWINQKS